MILTFQLFLIHINQITEEVGLDVRRRAEKKGSVGQAPCVKSEGPGRVAVEHSGGQVTKARED